MDSPSTEIAPVGVEQEGTPDQLKGFVDRALERPETLVACFLSKSGGNQLSEARIVDDRPRVVPVDRGVIFSDSDTSETGGKPQGYTSRFVGYDDGMGGQISIEEITDEGREEKELIFRSLLPDGRNQYIISRITFNDGEPPVFLSTTVKPNEKPMQFWDQSGGLIDLLTYNNKSSSDEQRRLVGRAITSVRTCLRNGGPSIGMLEKAGAAFQQKGAEVNNLPKIVNATT